MASQNLSQLTATTTSSTTDLYYLVQGGLDRSITYTNLQLSLSTNPNPLNSIVAKTTYVGSVSGNALWSMPFQGPSYKKFILNMQALHDGGGTITFPVVFTQIPYIYGDAAVVAISSASTSTLTLAVSAGVTGNLFVEGA